VKGILHTANGNSGYAFLSNDHQIGLTFHNQTAINQLSLCVGNLAVQGLYKDSELDPFFGFAPLHSPPPLGGLAWL